MGRKRKNHDAYQETIFSKRLSLLQEESEEDNDTVLCNLVKEDGSKVFNDEQTYRNYKTGKRFKQHQIDMLTSIAEYYGVTTDYLLGYDDEKNHTIKAAAEELQLSENAIKGIKSIVRNSNSQNPVLPILDFMLSNPVELERLLKDIYNHIYQKQKADVEDNPLDIDVINKDMLFSIKIMKYLEKLITPALNEYITLRDTEEQYYNSVEYEEKCLQQILEIENEKHDYTDNMEVSTVLKSCISAKNSEDI